MNSKMRSFVKGIMAGLLTKARMPMGEPVVPDEPVAYLYNGVRLPKLPEWDKNIYTGAFMWERAAFGLGDASYNDHAFFLYCAADCCVRYPEGTGLVSVTHGRYIAFRATDDGWNQVIFDGESSHTLTTEESPVFWASPDLMNEDGTVYLEASEPVPVYG